LVEDARDKLCELLDVACSVDGEGVGRESGVNCGKCESITIGPRPKLEAKIQIKYIEDNYIPFGAVK